MNKNAKGIIVVCVVAVAGLVAYNFFAKSKISSKSDMVYYLVSNKAASSYDGLMKLGDDFVKAWYDSMIAQKNDLRGRFMHNGVWYYNQGGSSVK